MQLLATKVALSAADVLSLDCPGCLELLIVQDCLTCRLYPDWVNQLDLLAYPERLRPFQVLCKLKKLI